MERLGEGGVEGVNERLCVIGQRVQRQKSSWPIQKQAQPPASVAEALDVSERDRFERLRVSVSEGVPVPRHHVEAPGLAAAVDPIALASLPLQALTRNSNSNKPRPLHLKVAASGQSLSAQHLLQLVKPLRVVRVKLLLLSKAHFPVALGQQEVHVHRVGVEGDITHV